MRIGLELRPVGEMRKRKKGEQKSQNRYISPLCGGAPCEPISTKFGVFVGLTNPITFTKNLSKVSIVFSGRQVEKRMFPFRKPTAYITLPCATALACDLRVTPTSESIHNSLTVLLDPENVEVTVGIPLPATTQDLHSELLCVSGITSAILISGSTRLDFSMV